MHQLVRLFLLGLIALALASGAFRDGTAPCTCGSQAAFAQAPAADAPAALPTTEATTAAPATAEPAAAEPAAAEPTAAEPTAAEPQGEPAAASTAPVGDTGSAAPVASPPLPGSAPPAPTGPLPKMIDLGAGKCIPCQKMKPILDEAKTLYAGRAEIVFIDVWENRAAGAQYGIRMIPTQIFYDASGKEVSRHEGFLSLEGIQKQFESMGVTLKRD